MLSRPDLSPGQGMAQVHPSTMKATSQTVLL
jgi:hypothetical protein